MKPSASGDYVRRVDYAAEEDRDLLRQVYGWALRNPAIYLDGAGYRDAEDFLDPPHRSFEYFVYLVGEPAALLTLIPLVTVRGVYQVGLITNPDASLRKICKLLSGFMGAVFDAFADALFVDLPDSPEFSPTRKLARFFGFTQVSETCFLLLKTEYVAEKERTDNQLPGFLPVLRHDARGEGALRVHARQDAA